ncbi:hypothetical protein AOLI_G00207440 [Acnodon oligacanthus]
MAGTSVTQGGFGLEMGDYRDRLGINLHFSAPSPYSRQTSSLLFAYRIRNQIGEATENSPPLPVPPGIGGGWRAKALIPGQRSSSRASAHKCSHYPGGSGSSQAGQRPWLLLFSALVAMMSGRPGHFTAAHMAMGTH